jgi:hypothetical protein
MNDELARQTESIAARLVLDSVDVVAICRAEQDLRALALGSSIAALGTAFAAAIVRAASVIAAALLLPEHRLQERGRPSLR